ncbi:hypothetical protein [Pseudomonas fragi]|uniref:hypothetical protein n=1 Tax=Pseudomonas fragi TaxID=296 RepID=UPI0014727D3F|nr:hypothetical protein [Pseudomonas fragi]NNB56175.1 hypothetical protein [Pseudomonas fragi]
MDSKLAQAFTLTTEEQGPMFERFANAFLTDDYPELQALGAKKDGGMDAYIYSEQDKIELVVQSCISPADKARTKVLDTVKKLILNKRGLPHTLVYCTTAMISTKLDITKKELRTNHKIILDVRDKAWFIQRNKTSEHRIRLVEDYCSILLAPFYESVKPVHLYSQVLSETEERVGLQYLEANNLDRSRGGNLTKGIFDALIGHTLRDSNPPDVAYSLDDIVKKISSMFPPSHMPRICEIVKGRIQHLSAKNIIHLDIQAGGYVLSFEHKKRIEKNFLDSQDREVFFRAEMKSAVESACEKYEIDYEFSSEQLGEIGHKCILWYLNAQGVALSREINGAGNILNTERLLDLYLEAFPIPDIALLDAVKDLLPHAMFEILRSSDTEIQSYIKAKSDLFIINSFLQVTPDVQVACKKLLSGDLLFLDTTILVRCVAESLLPADSRPIVQALSCAKLAGYKLRTWSPYIDELVSHIRGPVMLEWANHYAGESHDTIIKMLRTASTLINVFYLASTQKSTTFNRVAESIIGKSNYKENIAEYLLKEFDIRTDDIPPGSDSVIGNDERDRVLTAWRDGKYKHHNMPDERFEQLILNDVNCYLEILRLRRSTSTSGPNHGQKIWYLTLDKMPWRIARVVSPNRDAVYDVAMSLSYLVNCVATLANAGLASIPEDLIPATTILEESEMVPHDLRAIYLESWNPHEKQYIRERRLRDQIHQLKSSEDHGSEMSPMPIKIEFLPDEVI